MHETLPKILLGLASGQSSLILNPNDVGATRDNLEAQYSALSYVDQAILVKSGQELYLPAGSTLEKRSGGSITYFQAVLSPWEAPRPVRVRRSARDSQH